MDEMNPTTPEQAPTESMHPVLQQLHDKIASLETKVTEKETLDGIRVQEIRDLRLKKVQYEERVKNVLIEAMEDHDEETVKWIARNLDITLSVSKTYEVNVTFTIEVEHELGEEPDPDWDFEFEVSHSDIQDYSSDVIWSKEV